MTCDQAAEFMSRLFDGDSIPREAAVHLEDCAACRQRLADYSRMSVELRRYACAMLDEGLPEVSWEKNRQRPRSLWSLWRQTMKIPRFAFALMLVLIAALSTGLVLVRARDNQPWWFELDVQFAPREATAPSVPSAKDLEGETGTTGIRSADLERNASGLDFVNSLAQSQLAWTVRLIDSKDGVQQIGIRACEVPLGVDRKSAIEQAHAAPEQVDWYEPGKSIQIRLPESEPHLRITAQVLNESPAFLYLKQSILPKPDQLRLVWPALLRNGKFIGGLNGGTAEASGDGVAALFIPRQGLFLFSREKFEGAAQATLENSQVTFSLDGQSYMLFTGAPMAVFNGDARGTIWVRHLPKFVFRTSDGGVTSAVLSIRASEVPKFAEQQGLGN